MIEEESPGDLRRFKTRAMTGLSIILCILLLGFLVSFLAISRTSEVKDQVVRVEMENALEATRLLALNAQISADHRAYLLTGDQRFIARWEDERRDSTRMISGLREVVSTPKGSELVAHVETLEPKLMALEKESIQQRARGPLSPAVILEFETKLAPLRQDFENNLRALLDHKVSQLDEKKSAALRTTFTTKILIIAATAVALLLSLLVGIVFSRKLLRLHARLADANSTLRSQEESLKQAIRARDEMVAVVSHELKNPLTALGTGVMLIQRFLQKGSSTDDIRQVLGRMQPSLSRMSRLVADLLDITRIEASTLKLRSGPADLSAITTEVIQSYEPLAADKSIELKVEIDPEAQAVFGDKDRIGQVLSNLVHNAIKFTSEGGKITIQAGRIGEQVQVRVIGTGKGLLPEHLPQIFNRFWQAKDTAYMGTGLGLAIAKGLVEAQGGVIRVESRIGEGTTFLFTLPALRERGQAKIA